MAKEHPNISINILKELSENTFLKRVICVRFMSVPIHLPSLSSTRNIIKMCLHTTCEKFLKIGFSY